jgi:hypothetical protein
MGHDNAPLTKGDLLAFEGQLTHHIERLFDRIVADVAREFDALAKTLRSDLLGTPKTATRSLDERRPQSGE